MKPSLKNTYNPQKSLDFNIDSHKQLAFLLDKNNFSSSEPFKKNRIYPAILLLFTSGFFSYIALNAYRYHKIPENLDEIPLIKNDISPLKIIPTELGGEQFSNQDKLIYNNFEDQKLNKYKRNTIKAQQKKEGNNPVIEAASKEILNAEQQTKTAQTELIEKPSAKNKDQKQTVIKKKVLSTAKPQKNYPSSVFDLLD